MTLRITLLVLVTGLFALIWTQDQPRPAQEPRAAVAEPAPAPTPAKAVETGGTEMSLSSLKSEWLSGIKGGLEQALDKTCQVLEAAGRDWAKMQLANAARQVQLWMLAKAEGSVTVTEIAAQDFGMPLPEGIVPGEYRVVSTTGLVRSITLSRDDLSCQAEFSAREIYQSSDENGRWYFIRLTSNPLPMEPAIVERPEEELAPAEAIAGNLIVKTGRQLAERLIGFLRMAKARETLRTLKKIRQLSADEAKKNRR